MTSATLATAPAQPHARIHGWRHRRGETTPGTRRRRGSSHSHSLRTVTSNGANVVSMRTGRYDAFSLWKTQQVPVSPPAHTAIQPKPQPKPQQPHRHSQNHSHTCTGTGTGTGTASHGHTTTHKPVLCPRAINGILVHHSCRNHPDPARTQPLPILGPAVGVAIAEAVRTGERPSRGVAITPAPRQPQGRRQSAEGADAVRLMVTASWHQVARIQRGPQAGCEC